MKRTSNSAYTLIEMLVALSLMIIVLLGGTFLFIQNLRSGGLTEVDLKINRSSRYVLDSLERVLRFGSITSIDEMGRDDCLVASSSGIVGTNLLIKTLDGESINYYVSEEKIASQSAEAASPEYISGDDLSVNSWQLQWFCSSGLSDKIKIEMNISSTVLGTGVTITKNVSRDILLLNGSAN